MACYGFACLGLLGASTLVALAVDVIQVTTLHLHMCHIIITTVFYGLRLSTSTLWDLFQGVIILALEEHMANTFCQGSATTSCATELIGGFMKWITLFLGQSFLPWQLF